MGLGYVLAIAGTGLAALLRWGLGEVVGPISPYITFYPTVILSAIIGGTGPGILATALSALAVDWLFLGGAAGELGIGNVTDAVGMGLFCGINLVLSIVGGRLRAARLQVRAEARRAEAQARDLEQLVRLLDLASVLVRDLDDRITRWNTGCQRLYGYTGEQAIGQVSHTLLRTRFPEPLQTIRATLLATGRWEGELVHTTAGGHEIMVASEWVLWRDAAGRPVAILETNADITQRKRTEIALRESEQRFAAFMDHLPGAAWMKNLQGRYVYANPEAQRVFSRPMEQLRGKTDEEIFPPETARQFRENDRRALTEGGIIHSTEVLRLADGIDHHSIVSKFAIPGPDGRPAQVGGVAFDVTERKQAEEALAESRQRLAGIVDSAMDAIITVDEQQRIVQFNPAAEKMFRCPADQALSSHVERFIPQRFREAHRGHIQKFGQTGQTSRAMGHLGAISGLRSDGEEFPIEASISQVQVGQHKLFTVILRDITERKRAEEVLHQSEEKFRALAENAHASSGIIQGARFVYANSYLAEISGYTIPELLSMEFPQIVHPDFRPMMIERARRRQMGEPVPSHYEFKLLTKSGDVRWMDFSVGTILYEGKPAIIGSGFDITEHKRAVEAVRESQQQLQEVNLHLEQRIAERTAEAERRAEQLRELASELTRAEQHERSRVAGILHDHLQQLLVGAKFGTSVLRGQLGGESQRQALQKVDDLLDESLETSRNLTIELSPPILHEGTLAAALHWLAHWMHDKHGLHVHLKVDETLDPQDEGVRILLFESVRELLFNIVKHARTDSACATLERCNGEHLRIIVADAGPGFDPEQHRWHDRSRGGFGLFSMRERLGLIGGRFEIDSAPGQGAQMTLVAPLRLPSAEVVAEVLTGLPPAAAQVAAALLEAPASQPVALKESTRIRVLVADDHAVVRDGLAQLLQMAGDVEVIGLAGDGQQAIELAHSLRPDVILMDVSMPRVGGIEATRRVRSELPQVCVIGLSMHAEDEMAGRMREAGAASYLSKTAPPDAVLAAIRKCSCRLAVDPDAISSE